MSDCCNYSKSCPEPVSTVNVVTNNTVVNVGDSETSFRQEKLTMTQVGSTQEYTSTLAALPITVTALQIYINGILQEVGDDYVVTGQDISITFPDNVSSLDVASMNVIAIYPTIVV